MTYAVYASLYTVRPDGPAFTKIPVGFGDADFQSVCALMHGLDVRLANYPDLVCPNHGVTVGTSAKALMDATFEDQFWRIGSSNFSPAAYERMKHVRSQALMLALAGDEQTVQIFFERQ